MEPTQVSSPSHHGRSGHGAKGANTAKQEGAEEGHHGSNMASSRGDVKPVGYCGGLTWLTWVSGARVSSSCRRKVTTDSAGIDRSRLPVKAAPRAPAPPPAKPPTTRPTPPVASPPISMPMPAPPPMKAALRLPLPFLVRDRLLVSMRYCAPLTSNRVSVNASTDFPLNFPRLWATR